MTKQILIAGFGGQGILFSGKFLAYEGLIDGKEVSWLPSYGPEMRGGTANVTVIVSDERVCSPILNAFDTAVILNQQSLDKFEDKVKPGGVLLYDPNGITHKPTRTDIKIYTIEGAQLASDMGNTKVFNMIILGAYLKLRPIISMDKVQEGLEHSLPERAHKLIPLNMQAVEVGMNNVKEQ